MEPRYIKAAQYIQGTATKVALVSTNSITQGEQVSILWGELLNRYGVHIQFAHRTFKWSNEARGNANVFCVIIGFGLQKHTARRLYDYATPKAAPQELRVKNINPYLVDGPDVLVAKRTKPLSNVPEMIKGSQPTDGGNLLFTEEEKTAFLVKEPGAAPFIRPFMGSQEFINKELRYCLWLKDTSPTQLKQLPMVMERLQLVKQMRLSSTKAATTKWAQFPQLFTEDRQPSTDYLIVPLVSSENRRYIPIGFAEHNVVASNLASIIPTATPYLFGLLTSAMHMTWMRTVCGRLKSDFRYSGTLVYNNFPFPATPTPKQIALVEYKAQQVLDVRATFLQESLASLYNPLTMPPALVRAHQELDRAVDQCYRSAAFPTDLSRLEFLFEQYQHLSSLSSTNSKRKNKQ